MMLASVSRAISSPGLPATVTLPVFDGMPVLTVAAALPDEIPAVLLDELDHVSDFHTFARDSLAALRALASNA
jgi:hypothetical protein